MALVHRQNIRSRPVRGRELATAGTFGDFLNDFEGLFSELASPFYSQAQWVQGYPVDMYETGENIVLEMAVPGIHAQDLDISVEGRQLTIGGKLPDLTENEQRRYWLQGIPHGEFKRTVSLPTNVDLDAIHASVENGMLSLTMPKAAEAKARKIEITGA